MSYPNDLAVLYEHPEWQKPLFAALERRGIRYAAVDLKRAAFADADEPLAPLYFNQASPTAYVRGNTRAVPYALAYMRALQIRGVRVLNGADAFALELSKTAQAALLRKLGVPAPRVWTFNDLEALRARAHEIPFPVLLKPEQGGSGARIVLVESFQQLRGVACTSIRNTGCPTTCSCSRSTSTPTRRKASCAWSSSAASCSTRCA